jgi:hypothetical protein
MTTTQAPRVWKCLHVGRQSGYMMHGSQRICLECAADLYERGEGRYQAAWLLVHGRELDTKSRA